MTGLRGRSRLDERGRLVLPAAMRRRLGLRVGDEVTISEQSDGTLRVQSRQAAARALIESAGSTERSVVEELRADRQRQAAAEDQAASRYRR